MTRSNYEDFLTALGQEVPDLLKCRCGRVKTASALFDARDYDDIEGDWRCSVCLSAKDREEAVAAELANAPAPSWSLTCETGNNVRADRQRRLLACDWTQTLDAPLTAEKVTEWMSYRAALRDITNIYASPDLVIWPMPPA